MSRAKKKWNEELLRIYVKHLEWRTYPFESNHKSYLELCQFVRNVYVRELEPLRLEYRKGKLNERMHSLLTQGYKFAREMCRTHCIPWPPPSEQSIYASRINDLERKIEKIEEDLQRNQIKLEHLKKELSDEIKFFRLWNNQLK